MIPLACLGLWGQHTPLFHTAAKVTTRGRAPHYVTQSLFWPVTQHF